MFFLMDLFLLRSLFFLARLDYSHDQPYSKDSDDNLENGLFVVSNSIFYIIPSPEMISISGYVDIYISDLAWHYQKHIPFFYAFRFTHLIAKTSKYASCGILRCYIGKSLYNCSACRKCHPCN